MSDHPSCMHCGRPIHNTINAKWWDIGEVAGWVCWKSSSYDTINVYRKIRERLAKGLIDVSDHIPPTRFQDDDIEDDADYFL